LAANAKMGAGDFHQLMRNWEPLNQKTMSDELNESQETLIPDEGSQTQEPELDIETLKAQAGKADEYKKYADRLAAENKELKKSKEPLTTNESSANSERDLLVDLRLEGYSKTEAEFILRNGGRQALEDPLIAGAIETARKKTKSVDATPSGTGKSPVYQKYAEADLKKMSADELEKILPQ
jgi:hypothetical protein